MNADQQLVAQSGGAFSMQGFEHAQRVAKMLSSSDLIPKEFKGNIQNTMIALEMANRIGASPLMVMQNLYVVHGKPSWSSTFIISGINSCGKFEPLDFVVTGDGMEMECYAWTTRKGKEDKIIGPKVTMKMAKAEGWLDKPGSKWKTMPELMIRYRAAAFFGRLYSPEVLMGMQTADEVIDISHAEVMPEEQPKTNKEAERVVLMIQAAKSIEDLEGLKPYVQDGQQELFDNRMKELTPQE
jgi:hypothetical protein